MSFSMLNVKQEAVTTNFYNFWYGRSRIESKFMLSLAKAGLSTRLLILQRLLSGPGNLDEISTKPSQL